MTKCYLDSNILIYWNNESVDQHLAATRIIEELEKNGVNLFVSPLVLDEFLHAVSLAARVGRKRNVLEILMGSLDRLLALPLISIVNPPTDLISQKDVVILMGKYQLHPRDAYHLLTMQVNDIDGFATFDSDFKKVFAAKVLEKV